MKNKPQMHTDFKKQITQMAAILLLALSFMGCRTIKEAQAYTSDVRQTATSDAVRTSTDSVFIYQRDSIYIRERGDTVYMDRWHTNTVYRDRIRTDTLRVVDSVRVVVDNVIERVQGQSSWAVFERWCGRALLLIILLLTIYYFLKRKFKF